MSSWKNFVESLKNVDFMGKSEEAREIMEKGDLNKAKLLLLEELEDKPKSANLLFTMGSLLEEQGEYDQALKYYNRSLAIDNDDATIYNKARILIQELDEFEDGLKTIKSFRGMMKLNRELKNWKQKHYCILKNLINVKKYARRL